MELPGSLQTARIAARVSKTETAMRRSASEATLLVHPARIGRRDLLALEQHPDAGFADNAADDSRGQADARRELAGKRT